VVPGVLLLLASYGTPETWCLCVAWPSSGCKLVTELLDRWPGGARHCCLWVVHESVDCCFSVAAGVGVRGFAGTCAPVVKSWS